FDLHVLPARPHGRPLPVPEFALCRSLARAPRRGQVTKTSAHTPQTWESALRDLVDESLIQGRRVLVFVPSVKDGHGVMESLLRCGPGQRWDAGFRAKTVVADRASQNGVVGGASQV